MCMVKIMRNFLTVAILFSVSTLTFAETCTITNKKLGKTDVVKCVSYQNDDYGSISLHGLNDKKILKDVQSFEINVDDNFKKTLRLIKPSDDFVELGKIKEEKGCYNTPSYRICLK